MNVLIIGLGNMGYAILNALTEKNNIQVYGVDPVIAQNKISTDVPIFSSLTQASTAIEVEIHTILLAVKPQIINAVLTDLAKYLSPSSILISTVAATSISHITDTLAQQGTTHTKVARIMPTIAAKNKESLTGISFHDTLTQTDKDMVQEIISSFGSTVIIPESLMHAITGISGSGIAFVAEFIHALTLAGVREGLAHKDAYMIALQTVRGALSLLSSEDDTPPPYESPQSFINAVCSPGGTTIEGIHALHNNNFQAAIFAAVHAASNKSRNFNT